MRGAGRRVERRRPARGHGARRHGLSPRPDRSRRHGRERHRAPHRPGAAPPRDGRGPHEGQRRILRQPRRPDVRALLRADALSRSWPRRRLAPIESIVPCVLLQARRVGRNLVEHWREEEGAGPDCFPGCATLFSCDTIESMQTAAATGDHQGSRPVIHQTPTPGTPALPVTMVPESQAPRGERFTRGRRPSGPEKRQSRPRTSPSSSPRSTGTPTTITAARPRSTRRRGHSCRASVSTRIRSTRTTRSDADHYNRWSLLSIQLPLILQPEEVAHDETRCGAGRAVSGRRACRSRPLTPSRLSCRSRRWRRSGRTPPTSTATRSRTTTSGSGRRATPRSSSISRARTPTPKR